MRNLASDAQYLTSQSNSAVEPSVCHLRPGSNPPRRPFPNCPRPELLIPTCAHKDYMRELASTEPHL